MPDIKLASADYGEKIEKSQPGAVEQLLGGAAEEAPDFESFERSSESLLTQEAEKSTEKAAVPSPSGIVGIGQQRSRDEERMKKIESILADGLDGIYLAMDPASQLRFKQAGEEATGKINELVSRGKLNLRKVLDIIRDWLKLVPGVNKFFLEQEAKIKADKIMNLDSNYG